MLGYLPPSRLKAKSIVFPKTRCIGGQQLFVLCVVCLPLFIPTSLAVNLKQFDTQKPTKTDDTLKKPCDHCRELVQKFIEEFKRTDRGLYEGGDTDWELKNMKDYRKSEVRFIEITEKIYQSKVTHVMRLLEDVEENLEDFWREHWQHVGDSNELDSFLCVSLKKVCCPYGFFGAECSPCATGPDDKTSCSDHGTCNGNGTRTGSGMCECESGYKGSFCQDCKKGYTRQEDTKACININECANSKSPCEEGKFCEDRPGHYSCKPCHEACANLTCNGPGPENCTGGVCADGYDGLVGPDGTSIIGCTMKMDDENLGENDNNTEPSEKTNVTSDDVNGPVKVNIVRSNGKSSDEASLAERNKGSAGDVQEKGNGSKEEKREKESSAVLTENLESVPDLDLNKNSGDRSSDASEKNEL